VTSRTIGSVTRWIPRPAVADLALAVVLTTVNVVSLLPYTGQLHPAWAALLLVGVQGLPLALRRRCPIPVLVLIATARISYDVTGFGYAPFPLGPAIALYTVFERSRPLWCWVTLVLAPVGVAVSLSTPGHGEPYQAIYQTLVLIAAAAAGLISRFREMQLREQTSRADRAEAELELRATQERVRIARELHDVVAHHVSLIAVQAEAAASSLPDRPAVAGTSVEIIGNTARAALTELRRILGVLRSREGSSPMVSLDDLEDLLSQVRGAGLGVDMSVTGEPFPLAPGVALTAYRVVQESLTNTIRHSAARCATVLLGYEAGGLTVRVRDAGPSSGAAVEPGFGLAGLAERVASCGGDLSAGPDPGGGFTVTASLPAS
jgi:signal transduction histidine kinase